MHNGKKVYHIVACGLNGEIGKDNQLLWCIPDELKYFKEQTLGHVILMGRKTVESLPKPLERRVVYSVSKPKDVDDYDLLDYIYDASKTSTVMLNTDCIFVAGGGQLYEATADIADELWITQVNQEYLDADTYYKQPDGFEKYWSKQETNCLDRKSQKGVVLTFTKWKRSEH